MCIKLGKQWASLRIRGKDSRNALYTYLYKMINVSNIPPTAHRRARCILNRARGAQWCAVKPVTRQMRFFVKKKKEKKGRLQRITIIVDDKGEVKTCTRGGGVPVMTNAAECISK